MLKAKFLPDPLPIDRSHTPIDIVETRRPNMWRGPYLIFELIRLLLELAVERYVLRRLTARRAGIKVREYMEKLGGLWLKFGQVLALRTDVFPPDFCDEMSRLHGRAFGCSAKVIRRIIEEEYGYPLERVFAFFDDKPMAVASIGQVHRARLRCSEHTVIVKVQKPYSVERFQHDLAAISRLFAMVQFFDIWSFMRWNDLLWELRRMMTEELDFRYEASMYRRLRKYLKQHEVYVPKCYAKLCTQRVLVVEYIGGVLMSDFMYSLREKPAETQAWLTHNSINRAKIAEDLFLSLARQILEDNLFHGDLHPGNIMMLRYNRVALIDMGNVGTMDREFLSNYTHYMHLISDQNISAAIDYLLILTENVPPAAINPLRKDLLQTLREYIDKVKIDGMPFPEKSISRSLNDINRVMVRHQVVVNWAFLKTSKTFSCLDLTVGALYPEIDYIKTLEKYFVQAMPRQICRDIRWTVTLPHRLQSIENLVMPRLREAAFDYAALRDHVVMFCAGAMRMLTYLLWLGWLSTIYMYIYHHHPDIQQQLLSTDNYFVDNILNKSPKYDASTWRVFIFIYTIFNISVSRFIRKFDTASYRKT